MLANTVEELVDELLLISNEQNDNKLITWKKTSFFSTTIAYSNLQEMVCKRLTIESLGVMKNYTIVANVVMSYLQNDDNLFVKIFDSGKPISALEISTLFNHRIYKYALSDVFINEINTDGFGDNVEIKMTCQKIVDLNSR